MILMVRVVEARGLPAMDMNGFSDPYVRLQLGKHRAKTKVVKKSLNPVWDEGFSFRVGDLGDELLVSVLDEDKYFTDDFLGLLRVPLLKVLDADDLSLGTCWFPLQPKSKKPKNKDCGEILLTISLSQKNTLDVVRAVSQSNSDGRASNSDLSPEFKGDTVPSLSPRASFELTLEENEESDLEETTVSSGFIDRVFGFFNWKSIEPRLDSSSNPSSGVEIKSEESVQNHVVTQESDGQASDVPGVPFNELLQSMESRDQGIEVPTNLSGGVLIDQSYAVSSMELNSLLFSPTSNFLQSLADLQGTTGLVCESWKTENDGECLKRVVTYTKAATKLVKAVKATEEQTYLKVDGKSFAVLSSVSTPDVPFGSTFRCEVLYCITPRHELPSGEKTSHIVVSWRMNFHQSTMMKGMIESGAKQGLKDSYAEFADLLSQNVVPVDSSASGSSKEQILSSLQREQESDWKLAVLFFGNFTVMSTIFLCTFALIHIMLAKPSAIQGLEFSGLDMPDSIGEVVVCGILVLQGKRVLEMIGHFLQARKQRASDHGVKAQGDGWVLTVVLMEGCNLETMASSGLPDPYVVFSCNGRTKTSSIKFQALDSQWNEIFEFDAMDDPPSMMNVDVYDFDGPFDEAASIGHAEVNFVKSNLQELADVWVPLQGKIAQACQSKLHLRIFLNNTRGTEVVTQYLTKMEKEVGKKINLRSPQTNSAFQKIFSLPPEEFLINDFTCHLKRKMPVQGRLFLSPRIIGFYSNLFGCKTKFFFLWEDIDDIQVIPPSLSSMGSSSLLIILRNGRGMDAKHGAKTMDEDGRLKFHFQSFVSFNVVNRTIMALWKAKSLSPEQKMIMVEEDYEAKGLHSEVGCSFLGIEEANMSDIFSSSLPLEANSLMELFEGGPLEMKVMEKVGCVCYAVTPWESVKHDVYQRQINYKFAKNLSRYGGEVTSTQQKSPLPTQNGWIVEEVMALQGVFFGDYFNLHLRYQFEKNATRPKSCNAQVLLGIAWLKSTKHQKRISKNVISNSSARLKEMFELVEKEFTTGKQRLSVQT